jgi:hypothetical protein
VTPATDDGIDHGVTPARAARRRRNGYSDWPTSPPGTYVREAVHFQGDRLLLGNRPFYRSRLK